MDITTRLAGELAGIDTLNERDREQLRLLILDFFAASYAGYALNRGLNDAVGAVLLPRDGREESSVLLSARRYPAPTAASLNALYAHGADFDDGNKKAMGHIGVDVIPAVFALAETLDSSDEDVLTALAVGYEAFIRICSAAQPGMVKRGFHSTSMGGTLACAAACAKLLGLDARGMENAIALATTMTGGLLSYGDSRPEIKPLNPMKAAENGVFAALLAQQGVEGPEEALEGQNGWFHAAADGADETMLRGAADGHLLLHDCYLKLYPSCRHTHCGIEAASKLFARCAGEEIERVEVDIYPNAIHLAGQIRYPKNAGDTKFSIAYTLACALEKGAYGVEDMVHPHPTGRTRELIDRVTLIPDEQMEDRAKGIRGTRVRVFFKSGGTAEETVLVPKGEQPFPLTKEDVLVKLRMCVGGQLTAEQLDALVRRIDGMGGAKRFAYPARLV